MLSLLGCQGVPLARGILKEVENKLLRNIDGTIDTIPGQCEILRRSKSAPLDEGRKLGVSSYFGVRNKN